MNRLGLFGTIHFDRLSKVETELAGFTEAIDTDVVFVERPTDTADRRTVVAAAARVPLVLLGGVVLEILRAPFYLLFNRRFDSTEHVAIERLPTELPVHPVDRSLTTFMAESSLLAIVLSWLVLVAFFVVAPVQTAVTVGVLGVVGVGLYVMTRRNRTLAAVVGSLVFVAAVAVVAWIDVPSAVVLLVLAMLPAAVAAGVTIDTKTVLRVGIRVALAVVLGWLVLSADLTVEWFALVAYAATGLFVDRTLDVRNERMLDRATAIADEEGYDTGVFVTGLAHVSGLGERATGQGLVVSRTYTPRWLRAPGETDEDPTFEPDTGRDTVARDHPIQPGSTGLRAVASLIDLAVTAAVTWTIGIALDVVTGSAPGGTSLGAAGVVLAFVYYTALEVAFGRTLGKRLTKLVVTDEDGTAASVRACLLRNLVRPIDFVVFYFVGFVAMALTKRRRRLGDLIAGTEVRRVD